MVHFMCDVLLELSKLNRFFQYRRITYANIADQLEHTQGILEYLFAPDEEGQQPLVSTGWRMYRPWREVLLLISSILPSSVFLNPPT